jgi:hypothetical protein
MALMAIGAAGLKLSGFVNKAVSQILMALLFFLVVTPIALVMRMVGKRPLRLRPDRTAATYWTERKRPAGGASNMRRQF